MTENPDARKSLPGVNLGGWLVLEKWMTPSLFAGLDAPDEYYLCKSARIDVIARLRQHRRTFITLDDFIWLQAQGIQAVRLPVGYWAFGDEPPYIGCIEYIDKVFEWANQTGIKVVLDLHAAPGSQNGKVHSGKTGMTGWHNDEQNIIKTLQVLLRLTKRYATEPNLLGLELLNEPSHKIPRKVLLRYYEASYKLIRSLVGEEVYVIFSDGFRPRRWKRKLRQPAYQNVAIDTHQYQVYSAKDKKLNIAGHLRKTLDKVPKQLAKMARSHLVVVGEWSLALDPLSMKDLSHEDKQLAYRAYGAAQLLAYNHTSAWFYWNYKTEKGGVWSYRDCVEKGLLPRLYPQ